MNNGKRRRLAKQARKVKGTDAMAPTLGAVIWEARRV